MTEYDVVVVGAGISGLYAAYHMIKKVPDMKVLVLEAKDRVGGRTCSRTLKCRNGVEEFDMGGQWVGGDHWHIRTLLEELELQLHTQYIEGRKAIQFVDQQVVYYTDDNVPYKHLPVMIDFSTFVSKIDGHCNDVSVQFPELSCNINAFDSMTMDEFKRKNLWTEGACTSLDSVIACVFGCDAAQVSVSYFLHYCAAAGGLAHVLRAGELGAQAFSIKGGAQQVSIKLYDKLGQNRVRMNSPVSSISQTDDALIVTIANDVSYRTRHVIMALPPNQITRIEFEPPLPTEKRQLYDRLPVGCLIKINITYKEAFWRRNGLSGEFVTYGGRCRLDGSRGPLCVAYDACTSQDNPALVAFIGGSQALFWSDKNPTARRQAVLDSLEECFGSLVHEYIDYQEKDWSRESYNGGCPTYPATTGVMRHFRRGLQQPVGRIYFAGTETAALYCGYMNGAVEAGERASIQVLCELHPEVIDDVETIKRMRSRSGHSSSPKTIVVNSCWKSRLLVIGGIGLIAGMVYTYRWRAR